MCAKRLYSILSKYVSLTKFCTCLTDVSDFPDFSPVQPRIRIFEHIVTQNEGGNPYM